MRYHYITGFKPADRPKLKQRAVYLNGLPYIWTAHAKSQMLNRVWDYNLLRESMRRKLEYNNIIEYYTDNEGQYILKTVHRLQYSDKQDLIIILNSQKEIITCYLNNKDDHHNTLKKELYTRP